MKIYGNRTLKTVPGQLTRPTSAKVREALFNIWQSTIIDCRWLDLCAGNGSMGAEALCRGAKEAVAIEQYGRACEIIQQNWQSVANSSQKIQIIRGNVITKLSTLSEKPFDRIYFDPPYNSDLYQPVLEAIVTYNILDETGEIAVEHDPKLWEAITLDGLAICRQKIYGNTALTFYQID